MSQNRKTVIAFADEKLLRPIRRKMWEMARSYTAPPFTFESERRVTVSSAAAVFGEANAAAKAPVAFIGDRISVDGEKIALPMRNEPGRNIAILGTPDGDCNQAIGIIQSAALSLACQHPQGDARFIFCDFANEELTFEQKYPQFVTLMERTGFTIETTAPESFSDLLQELNEQQPGRDTVYLFGAMLDRWICNNDPYGDGSPLKALVESGPARKIHFIGWWVKGSKYTAQVAGYGNSDAFNTKVFLRTDERTVQSMTSPFVRWAPQSNRGLIVDEVEYQEELTFIPYAPVSDGDLAEFRHSGARR